LSGKFVLEKETVMKVYCKTCALAVTKDLVLYKGKSFGEADSQDYIQSGFYAISDGVYFTKTKNFVIVNVSDILNIKNHSNGSRLNGCCGLDGCDGPNKVCMNGHEVATEKSDCWMPHAMIFEKDKTILK
jgi:hypothetical protein